MPLLCPINLQLHFMFVHSWKNLEELLNLALIQNKNINPFQRSNIECMELSSSNPFAS